jgi:hypothetical protein
LGKSLQQLGRETLFNELIDVAADFVNMIVLQEDDVIEETYKKASIIVCVISVGSFLASIIYIYWHNGKKAALLQEAYDKDHFPGESTGSFLEHVGHERSFGRLANLAQQRSSVELAVTMGENVPSSFLNLVIMCKKGITTGTQLTTAMISIAHLIYTFLLVFWLAHDGSNRLN